MAGGFLDCCRIDIPTIEGLVRFALTVSLSLVVVVWFFMSPRWPK
jgi:hypothetical protein